MLDLGGACTPMAVGTPRFEMDARDDSPMQNTDIHTGWPPFPSSARRQCPAHSGCRLALRHGFTLIEVIVVSVIIAVLAAVAIPIYNGYLSDARKDVAKNNCQLIGAAVMQVHNQGKNITNSTWADIGMQNLSDQTWTYTFTRSGGAVYQGIDQIDSGYTITATGSDGVPGGFKPYQPALPASGRWTGIFP